MSLAPRATSPMGDSGEGGNDCRGGDGGGRSWSAAVTGMPKTERIRRAFASASNALSTVLSLALHRRQRAPPDSIIEPHAAQAWLAEHGPRSVFRQRHVAP